MAVKFKPTSAIKINLGINKGGPVEKFATHTCRIHMDKYVPYYDGNLRRNVVEGQDYVEYNSPYAHYMYEGVLYVDPETGSSWAKKHATKVPTNRNLHYHTAGTGDHWDERMWSAEKHQVINEIQDYVRRK